MAQPRGAPQNDDHFISEVAAMATNEIYKNVHRISFLMLNGKPRKKIRVHKAYSAASRVPHFSRPDISFPRSTHFHQAQSLPLQLNVRFLHNTPSNASHLPMRYIYDTWCSCRPPTPRPAHLPITHISAWCIFWDLAHVFSPDTSSHITHIPTRWTIQTLKHFQARFSEWHINSGSVMREAALPFVTLPAPRMCYSCRDL